MPSDQDPAGMAADAVRLALADPGAAGRLAAEAARLADARRDHDTGSVAERALGLVAMQLENFDAAAAHLRRAVRIATRGSEPAAEARMTLAYVLSRQGRTGQALRHLERAAPVLHGLPAAWLAMHRAVILKGLGRWAEALDGFRTAVQGFQRHDDRLGLARAHTNRGVLHLYRGDYAAAEDDLRIAEELARALDQHLTSAIAWHNLGCAAAGRGDVPVALSRFDRAQREYERHRRPPPTLAMDRCEVALSVGLGTEAVAAAEQAVDGFTSSRQPADLAEATLLLAQARLLIGDPAGARAAAEQAAAAFAAQRRHRWAVRARYVALQAANEQQNRLGQVDRLTVTPQAAARAADALARAGWTGWSIDARLLAGQLALTAGRPVPARRQLAQAAARRTRGAARSRAQGWHAEALLRLQAGDRGGAYRATTRGIRVLQEHHAALGATDLRAGAAANLADLARLRLRIALDGRPHTVLEAAERVRAAHLLRRPVRPPRDDLLAQELAELRRVGRALVDAVSAGRPTDELRRRMVELERSVRDRSRLAAGGPGAGSGVPSVAALAARLGDRALVEYLDVDGELCALTLAGGRLRLHRLGPAKRIARRLDILPFVLGRLAVRTGSAGSLRAADEAAAFTARELDEALLRPLRRQLGERPLVVVPTAPMQTLSWSLLPSSRQRPVSVAPSATLWYRAAGPVPGPVGPDGPVVFVAGPGLPGAEAEVRTLAATVPQPVCLVGAEATVERVSAALSGADLAHVAAHGRLRADNPQFSALHLHDGPLTVYDLERLATAPRRVILSACDTGRGAALPGRPGGETLGPVHAFLALGTRALVASVLPLVDPDVPKLMTDLHGELQRGEPVAAALATAQTWAVERGDTALAASLVCYGAG